MQDSLYRKIYTINNLELAWNRICSGQNVQYKNYYRHLLVAYTLYLKENLKRLSERLKGGSYEPSDVLRFYIPKRSGLHRPITFLHLDDLIVYHAIVNIIAVKFIESRKEVENSNVFSVLLNQNDDKNIFFFKKWQEGYLRYLKKIKILYEEGNTWVAHFDLAAYYDTISHEMLSSQISRSSYNDFKLLLRRCLEKWSTHKSLKLGHGIPQGPIASNFIGEIYLLPVDIKLNENNIKYLRYVDDIKIFGASKEEVLNGIILLESECKERGLIPQAKKYEIINATTIDEAIGKNPSLKGDEKDVIFSNKKEAAKLLASSFDKDSFDSTRIKYIIKSSEQNEDILKIVLGKINEHPELVDTFFKFLLKYNLNEEVGKSIISLAIKNPSPYKYVEGKYWELLSYYNIRRFQKKSLINVAIERLRKHPYEYCLKHGLYKFICSTNNKLILKWLKYEKSSLLQAFVIPYFNFINEDAYLEAIKIVSHRSHYEPILAAVKRLKDTLESKDEDIKKILSRVKDDAGVIKNILGIPEKIDSIGQIIKRRYDLPYFAKWKKFFGAEYKHANYILFLADKPFFIEKNAWVNYTDTFNEVIVRKWIGLLIIKRRTVSWPTLIGRDNRIVDYGILLDPSNALSRQYPDIIDGFRSLHEKRRSIVTSHAYDKNTARQTTYVSGKEHKELCKNLKKSYSDLINELNNLI